MHRNLSLLATAFFILCNSLLSASSNDMELLLAKLRTAASDSVKVDLYNEIAFKYYRSDPSRTLKYATEAITLADSIDYDFGQVMGLKNKGIGQMFLNDPKASLRTFQEVIRISEEKGFKNTLHRALNNSGNILKDFGRHEEALKAFQRAALIAKMEGFESEYCLYTCNLAALFADQGDKEKAYRIFSGIYTIANRLGDKTLKADIRFGMAKIHLDMDRYKESLAYFAEASELYDDLEAKGGIIETLINIGKVHDKRNDQKSALRYYKKALVKAEEFGASTFITECYEQIASSALANGSFRLAIENSEKGLKHAERANRIDIQKAFYVKLSTAYEEIGNYQEALAFHKKMKLLEDELKRDSEAQKIAELQLKYNDQAQAIENKLLKEQQVLHQSQLRKNKWIAGLIGLALVLVSAISFFLYNNNQQKIKYNISLRKEVDNRTSELERSNIALKNSNRELERFTHIASHDLKEPLRNISSFIRLIERRLVGKNESLKEYLQFVQNNAKQMNVLIEDVLEFSQVEKKGLTMEMVDMNAIVNQVQIGLKNIAKKNHVIIDFSKLPIIYFNSGQLYLLLKNIIENGLRFNKSPIKHIKINYSEEEGNHIIAIRDNGIGIDEDYREKIFEMFERLQNRQNYRGSGLGLSLCKKIVESHHGKIWVDSNIGGGSVFYIKMPIRNMPVTKVNIDFSKQSKEEKAIAFNAVKYDRQ